MEPQINIRRAISMLSASACVSVSLAADQGTTSIRLQTMVTENATSRFRIVDGTCTLSGSAAMSCDLHDVALIQIYDDRQDCLVVASSYQRVFEKRDEPIAGLAPVTWRSSRTVDVCGTVEQTTLRPDGKMEIEYVSRPDAERRAECLIVPGVDRHQVLTSMSGQPMPNCRTARPAR